MAGPRAPARRRHRAASGGQRPSPHRSRARGPIHGRGVGKPCWLWTVPDGLPDASLARAKQDWVREHMARIALIDRANMNVEQAQVYDAAKAAGGPLGGPYYAYIRLPKLFAAAQNLRGTLAAGPLSHREQQIVNLTVARHWNARYPWHAQVRNSLKVGISQAVRLTINRRRTPER